ncbi:hypothetical protein J3U99_20670 [Brucella pituitosa]|uniref:hypothetical protein n=1 Tax=Brucella pituitosa TaxID=571256 RepID=UPI002002DE39|nr:hypothetical protein [Brucella pituitosa]MCK4207185.1 hypothetical protein [Brucella pituitosa]
MASLNSEAWGIIAFALLQKVDELSHQRLGNRLDHRQFDCASVGFESEYSYQRILVEYGIACASDVQASVFA